MDFVESLKYKFKLPEENSQYRSFWQWIHIDLPLFISVLLLITFGFFVLYSAGNQQFTTIEKQAMHIGLSMMVMFVLAQIPPNTYQRWAIWIYALSLLALFAVLIFGHIGKGAERWLKLGFFRFQPSEVMKLAIPMMLAAHFQKVHLPLTFRNIFFAMIIIFVPVILTAKQPDLGTAILLMIAGISVLFLAGIRWRLIIGAVIAFICSLPVLWYFLHDYQRRRVLTLFNPERDPLGSGYHIIQSKIAIGSGGLFGKGWLNGTQSHLNFLPEHSTDFIFAVSGEEFGFLGSLILIFLFMLIICRGLYIAIHAQDTFTRLLAGSLILTFFASFFINVGMVTGILPVVGIPLPLVSYGGTSMVTIMATFGILMSIQTHRKLLTS